MSNAPLVSGAWIICFEYFSCSCGIIYYQPVEPDLDLICPVQADEWNPVAAPIQAGLGLLKSLFVSTLSLILTVPSYQDKRQSALRAYPNSFTARWAIIIAVFASEPGAESLLAMVIRPNGWRPIRVESPGPPFE